MPSFENMESFGYTLLQTPLESLIISYPIAGLKDVLDNLPTEKPSSVYSSSFDEEVPKEEEEDIVHHGYEAISLGKQILKAETASLCALALISHFWNL